MENNPYDQGGISSSKNSIKKRKKKERFCDI